MEYKKFYAFVVRHIEYICDMINQQILPTSARERKLDPSGS